MAATNSRGQVVNAATSAPTPTLTVAAVARRLGVAPPTLRTWDRRYGLGPSAHTAGAHRRYSPADVARLMVMRRLTLEGVSPADAAKIALATAVSAEGRPMHTPADGYDLSGAGEPSLSSVPTDDNPDPSTQNRPFRDDDGFAVEPSVRSDYAALDWPQAFSEAAESEVPAQAAPAGALTPTGDEGRTREQSATPARSAGLVGAGKGFEPDRTEGSAARDDVDVLELDDDLALRDEQDDTFERPDEDLDDWSGVLRSVPSERAASGGGRVVAMPDGTPQSRGLARAAMSLDTYETDRILREIIRRDGVAPAWNSTIMPVLRALGERTRMTGDGIDVEHAFSEVILGVMRAAVVGVPHAANAPVVLLACADSDYHSLPLHALAATLAEREVPTRMLGSGLPPHALMASVRRTGPSVIVLFARMSGADAGDVEGLRRQRPAPTVILAGPGWLTETIPSSARTASSLLEAVDEVLRAIHA